MGNDNSSKNWLLKASFVLLILLIVWNLYTGATVQEIGIPGIFTIKFGSRGDDSNTQPAQSLTFTFSPNPARRGEDVLLYLSESKPVTVYYNGRPLPKKVSPDGKVLTVTVPGDARNGFFELTWDGQSVRASQELIVLP